MKLLVLIFLFNVLMFNVLMFFKGVSEADACASAYFQFSKIQLSYFLELTHFIPANNSIFFIKLV